jgi:hypothetical protein
MLNRIKVALLALGVSLAGLIALAPIAGAAAGGNGLRVSPVRTDLTINPGQSQTVTVNVTNVTSAPATLQAIINDFTANPDESGNPALLLNGAFASSHSLKRFIAPISNFTLQPNQQQAVEIKVSVPKNAPGGGYYGAVRFANASNSKNGQISLAGSVGSLILVKVPGDIVDKLSVASFDARVNDRPNSFFTNNHKIDAVIRFQNERNVQEEPFGKILLKNRSGKVLATYEINSKSPPGNVLPDSIRKFSIPLGKKVGSFGEYKLEGNFGYGGNGSQLLSASTTFYVIPVWLIVLFLAIVALIVFLIFGLPKLVRGYNERVVRRAGRR